MVSPIGTSYSISHSRSSLGNAGAGVAPKPVPKSISQANFWDTYEYMCTLQSQAPLHFLKLSLSTGAGSSLVIDADKIKASEWDPICAALSINKNLKAIKIECKYLLPSNEKSNHDSTLVRVKKPPSIRTRERINKLCRSLRDCLTVTTSLNQLEIFNIPLIVKDCVQLGKVNTRIKTLTIS